MRRERDDGYGRLPDPHARADRETGERVAGGDASRPPRRERLAGSRTRSLAHRGGARRGVTGGASAPASRALRHLAWRLLPSSLAAIPRGAKRQNCRAKEVAI